MLDLKSGVTSSRQFLNFMPYKDDLFCKKSCSIDFVNYDDFRRVYLLNCGSFVPKTKRTLLNYAALFIYQPKYTHHNVGFGKKSGVIQVMFAFLALQ